MIRPVVGTVVSRVVIAVANLLVIVAAGQALGAVGLGTISLVVLGITIILLFTHIVGGGGLVYLIPRYGVRPLLVPSYSWVLICAAAASLIQQFIPLVPSEYVIHIVLLGGLQGLNSIHLGILLGRERIGLLNRVVVIQSIVQLAAFAVLLGMGGASVMDYVVATYLAHGTAVLISGTFALQRLETSRTRPEGVLKGLLHQGTLAQGANILQLLNYRLAYYLIEHFRGRAALGIFSVTTQLAESTWLVPKSIGGVLYSKVSNLVEAERQRDLTMILLKLAVAVAVISCAALLLIPDAAYSWIFGPEISGLRPILVRMAPGLIAMSASQVLSHFLSGTGRIKHNTIGSGIGLVITVLVGFWLIPTSGLEGAAVTASLAYGLSVCYQLIVFRRVTGTSWAELLPHSGDRERAMRVWDRLKQRLVK